MDFIERNEIFMDNEGMIRRVMRRNWALICAMRLVSAPVRFCNFSPNKECKKTAGKGVQPLNNYTCRFRPSSLNCTDKSGLDGLQADKWISG